MCFLDQYVLFDQYVLSESICTICINMYFLDQYYLRAVLLVEIIDQL